MRIELPAAPPTATAWHRPDQSLTLTFGPECGATAETPADEPASRPLWQVGLGSADQRGLVLTLRAPEAR